MLQKIKTVIAVPVSKVRSGFRMLCVRAVQATAGEMYIDTAAKVLMACVLGMMLLVAFYALFKSNILPNVTNQITNMFSYSA